MLCGKANPYPIVQNRFNWPVDLPMNMRNPAAELRAILTPFRRLSPPSLRLKYHARLTIASRTFGSFRSLPGPASGGILDPVRPGRGGRRVWKQWLPLADMRYIQTSRFEVPEFEIKRTGTYRPRNSPEHLRRLRLLKERSKKPITRLVEEALEDYLNKQKGGEKKWARRFLLAKKSSSC